MKYCIINDEDGHLYLCPVENVEEAHKYFNDIYKLYYDGDYDLDAPEMPSFLSVIDNLEKLCFQIPEVLA